MTLTKYLVAPPIYSPVSEARFIINKLFECSHVWAVRYQKCLDGRIVYRNQCTKCGRKESAVAKSQLTQEQMVNALLIDDEAAETYWRTLREAQEKRVSNEKAKHNNDWWLWYQAYLQSSVWLEKRQLVLARAQGVCEACRRALATEVHHLTYQHVGQEPLFNLVAVCQSCHQWLTEQTNKRQNEN